MEVNPQKNKVSIVNYRQKTAIKLQLLSPYWMAATSF
jgi:hypothetical protein